MRSLRHQVLALLVGVAIVLPSTVFARAHYFCHMMDRVMASPCCEAEHEATAISRQGQEVRAPDCCVRVDPSARKVAPSTRTYEVTVPTLALAATIVDRVYVPLRGREVGTTLRQARAPPPLGPPLFVAHCSFLI